MAESRWRWLVPTILVLIVLAVLIASWFYFFADVSSASHLIPSDNMLYLRLDPDTGDIIPNQEEGYIERLGAVFWQSFSLNNPFFSYEEDIKPWLGEEIVLAKASPDLLDPFVILAQVGDKSEALKSIEELSESFVGGRGEVTTERYKGVDVYILDNPVSLAGCYLKGYVILSSSSDSIKEIIDVGNGDSESLADNKEFKKLESNLSEDEPSLLAALRLQEALSATTSSLGSNAQLFAKRLSLPEEMMLGVAIWPEDKGLRVKTHTGTARFEDFKSIEPHLQTVIPSETIGYYEGEGFSKLVTEFMGDTVRINQEAADWANGSYAIALLPQSGDKKSAFAVIIEVPDGGFAAAKLKEAEPLIIAGLSSLGIVGPTEFQDGTMDDESTRYATFSEGIEMNLNYIVKDNKIVITTSPEALALVLDTMAGNVSSIADDPVYMNILSEVTDPQQMGLFYLNTDSLSGILDDQEMPLPESEQPQGFLEGVLAPFSGLGIGMYNSGRGDFLTNVFLRFRDSNE